MKHVDPEAGWVVLKNHDLQVTRVHQVTFRPRLLEVIQDLAIDLSWNEEPPW